MPNLRIIYDNAADRSALVASTTAGALAVANLQTDVKSDVWRATATSASISGALPGVETASGVHLIGNFSPTATIRVRLYSDAGRTAMVFDSGFVPACPAPALVPRGWTPVQAASAYAYGGGAHARVWFAERAYRGYTIDLVDANNLQGYIEAARLIIGAYWSPAYNASEASMTPVDTTVLYRTDAGDQAADAGHIYRQVSIDMSAMPAADRTACARFLRNSRAYPILLSLFPESQDLELERDNAIYGRRAQDSELAIQNSVTYGTKIAIEEF